MQTKLQFSKDHPALAGHFPGDPIVPAALLLDELSWRLSKVLGVSCGADLNAVKQVRLLAPIRPDQPVVVVCDAKNETDYRFLCSVAGKPVAKGVICREQTENQPVLVPLDSLSAGLDVMGLYEYLPHGGNMRLLSGQTGYSATEISCVAVPHEINPFHRDGELPLWVTLEYAAQAIACHGILNRSRVDSSLPLRKAMIVGIKRMVLSEGVTLSANKPLDVTAQMLAHQPDAASYMFQAAIKEKVISSGQMSVIYS